MQSFIEESITFEGLRDHSAMDSDPRDIDCHPEVEMEGLGEGPTDKKKSGDLCVEERGMSIGATIANLKEKSFLI